MNGTGNLVSSDAEFMSCCVYYIHVLDILTRIFQGGCRRDRMDLQLPVQLMSTTTNVVSLNPLMARYTRYNIM